MYVLQTEKYLSVPCVIHEKLFSCLDVLHMYTPIISILLILWKCVILMKLIIPWLSPLVLLYLLKHLISLEVINIFPTYKKISAKKSTWLAVIKKGLLNLVSGINQENVRTYFEKTVHTQIEHLYQERASMGSTKKTHP